MLTTIKRWVQSTVGVSSSEANAFLIMLPVMFLLIFSEPLYRWAFTDNKPLPVSEVVLLDSAVTRVQSKVESKNKVRVDSIAFFPFNPNIATINELKSMGIPEAVAKRIEQYRLKGGKFKVKRDLAKMYDLDSTLYISLAPFIDLPETIISEKPHAEVKKILVVEYDLNKADTADLKSVKGIGPVLASRILKYRASLGGFVRSAQLKEVYGLDSAVMQELAKFYVMNDFSPAKLKINELTELELDKHPYLSIKQAKAIVAYRMQHGPFRSMNDLRNVKLLNDATIQKLVPYLSFE